MDSRATGEFIDHHYAKSNWLHPCKLSEPIPVYNVDGTLNEAGSITEVVDLILRIGITRNGHYSLLLA